MLKYKTIFSLRIRAELSRKGVEPILESDNREHPGWKCWLYAVTPEFEQAMKELGVVV